MAMKFLGKTELVLITSNPRVIESREMLMSMLSRTCGPQIAL